MLDHIPDLRKIAFIGDYLPRKCGIATFTYDLQTAVAAAYPQIESFVVPVNDIEAGYDYPGEVRFEFAENDLDSYRRTAAYLNFSNVDVVCLQHEYGIFGGAAGSFILPLLRDLRIPIVSTLHTVLEKPDADQRRVMVELASLSARLVVMSERGRRMLGEVYGVPEEKIDLIPHGIPDLPFVDSNFYKDQFGVEGKNVLLTFGLLSPNKGIEVMLKAIPEIIKVFPNLVYIILGATHPNLLRENGEAYRLSLERRAQDLGIRSHVSFFNRFVDQEQLKTFLGVCDIYITPYLNVAQSTSGTLAYAFGSGKAVVSTPYWHAQELLGEDRGVLVPFGDSRAMAQAVIDLLQDDKRRHAMRKKAFLIGREMTWDKTADQYLLSFERARQSPSSLSVSRLAVPTLAEERLELPEVKLDHLRNLSDSTGIFQHAIYTLADLTHGYCIDDNARALICTVLLEELEVDRPELRRLAKTYASFLQYAFDPAIRRFHNFMSFDRQWLDAHGSEDSHGRALWALGTCVGRSKHQDLQAWAAQLFEKALPPILEMSSPRAWSFALLGIYEYFRRLSGDRMADNAREILTDKLIGLYDSISTPDWPWFEESLSYDNARLPQVMILSGRWANNPRAFQIGLESLRWLVDLQKAPSGHFRPIGSEGFYKRGGPRAELRPAADRGARHPLRLPGNVSFHRRCRPGTRRRGSPSNGFWDATIWACRSTITTIGRMLRRLAHRPGESQNQGAESTLALPHFVERNGAARARHEGIQKTD
jgi:glycosyltransferase involved in cell wall biosynthesis